MATVAASSSTTPVASTATMASSVGSNRSTSASASVLTLPPSSAAAMPGHMYYTSLQWLASSAGVPRLTSETPPTSPDVRRFMPMHTPSKTSAAGLQTPSKTPGSARHPPETPEQRRERQAKFLDEKNRELETIRKKTVKDLLREAELEGLTPVKARVAAIDQANDASTDSTHSSTDSPPMTPKKKPAVPSEDEVDPASLLSPEKRRAKKLTALQYPFFSAHWWDVPVPVSTDDDDPNERRDAPGVSRGVVLLGGGGGRKGAGIDSGILVCTLLPSNAPVFASASSPIRMSSVSSKAVALHPVSFLDSNDFLVGSMLPHPREPVLAATVGAGTALLRADGLDEKLTFHYHHAVQTDFSKELNAQAQAWAPSGKWLITGGEDKVLRVWSYPALTLIAVCTGNEMNLPAGSPDEQHRQPILSLHVNHDGTRVVSCAGDGFVKVWDTSEIEQFESDKEHEESKLSLPSSSIMRCALLANLTIPPIKGANLKFQAARFYGRKRMTASTADSNADSAADEGEEQLIAIASQIKRGGSKSWLVKYAPSNDNAWICAKRVAIGQAPLTTMEISDDVARPLIGVANTDGAVEIYSSHTLKCIKRINKVHDLPATSLTFSPARLSAASPFGPASPRYLLSASADKSVALLEVPTNSSGSNGAGGLSRFFIVLAVLLLVTLLAAHALGVDINQAAIDKYMALLRDTLNRAL